MKWVAKALVQSAFSYVPGGERLNYVLQRHVFKSLPGSDAVFRGKLARAFRHFEAFREHGPKRDPSEAVFYEFGAGWDLIVPLAYYALGVERQILVDIRPLVRLELVADTIRKFDRHWRALEQEAPGPLRPLGGAPVESVADLEQRFGIAYHAPRDARDTGLPGASIDFISSTDTVEHIPEDDLLRILRECRRLLKPDGVMSYRIDLEDHYAHFDPTISKFNFLRFSDRTWRLLNPPLHYQSRLRYPDHVRLAERAGLEIVDEIVSRASERDLERARGLEVAERFRNGYSRDDLMVKGLTIVARARAA
ncbi:MAG: class I SAM-dependent methyltransferase [Actinomycetota bacterium]|nr:class I SAM-dependent methyltransferase [Actinomycetota bacterium]